MEWFGVCVSVCDSYVCEPLKKLFLANCEKTSITRNTPITTSIQLCSKLKNVIHQYMSIRKNTSIAKKRTFFMADQAEHSSSLWKDLLLLRQYPLPPGQDPLPQQDYPLPQRGDSFAQWTDKARFITSEAKIFDLSRKIRYLKGKNRYFIGWIRYI